MVSRLVCIAVLLGAVSACSFNGDEQSQAEVKTPPRKTLSTLDITPVSLDKSPLPAMDITSLRDAYRQLQGMATDVETQQIVQYRLADLEILLAEEKQEKGEGSDQQGLYDLAISQYQQILQTYPQQENASVLYQLAKAYDLQGDAVQSFETIETLLAQYPQNPYLAEVYFRKGEISYAQNNYPGAINAYRQVLAQGNDTAYFVTAAYMLGWSYFKAEQTQPALLAFTQLLDHRLAEQPSSPIGEQDTGPLDFLPKGERRLVVDTIRIMAMLFSYEGAELSLVSHFEEVGERHYEHMLYDELGQQFLNDDRFRDSAKVYQAFTEQHSDHVKAPFFAVKQIDAYILGKFPSLVLPAKQSFVERYGIRGQYWLGWSEELQEQVSPFLHAYLKELAQFEHAKAQLLASVVGQSQDIVYDSESPKQNSDRLEKKQQAYAMAARYYLEFIDTFPFDPDTPEMTFNLAESLFESGSFLAAVEHYQRYAYEYLNEPNAVEAGYAAILSYREALDEGENAEQKTLLVDQQLDAQNRFVLKFSDDPRALEVLYDSTQTLFAMQRFEQAHRSAAQLLAWQPAISGDKYLASLQISAHSQFELENFAKAEGFYEQILLVESQTAQQKLDMTERLAASIYKQGEQKLAAQEIALAVEDFLRVISKAPYSSIRINAQFDAATHLLALEKWQQASELLEDFRTRFAGHSLNEGIEDKLIFAYQQNQNWLAAAEELLAVWKGTPNSEQGRQALYVAAQYFQQEGQTQRSLESFRTYAHRYPEPFAEATEARFTMSEFYRQSKEDSKRRYWLNKLIKADAEAGDARTDRSRYLAAMSSLVFANDKLAYFKKIRLTLPLSASLKKKKTALENALSAFNKTQNYNVAEFSTDAKYKVANIYHLLAKDLMASQRPKGLNQLELEQYNILLEEQSYPFEEKAIELHEVNTVLSQKGIYDDWVKQSFTALAELSPGRYNKREQILEANNEIY